MRLVVPLPCCVGEQTEINTISNNITLANLLLSHQIITI
ncbi:hypothetical protein V6Z11_D01G172500 [Gossypium hirsutum]